ncbi:RNA-directed DNA polymerase, eukaryota [Tanacetum coccineum]
MGSFRSKEDDVAKISTSDFVLNFGFFLSQGPFLSCVNIIGHVDGSFIPMKRLERLASDLGLFRFINVFNRDQKNGNKYKTANQKKHEGRKNTFMDLAKTARIILNSLNWQRTFRDNVGRVGLGFQVLRKRPHDFLPEGKVPIGFELKKLRWIPSSRRRRGYDHTKPGEFSAVNSRIFGLYIDGGVQGNSRCLTIPRTGGSILSVMEKLLKVDIIPMGFINMDGIKETIPKIVNNRLEILGKLQQVNKAQASEVAQKAKIKWYVEGDENTKFFHGMLNKKRSQLNIRECSYDMLFPIFLSTVSAVRLECMVFYRMRSKRRLFVENCGTDKSPGPDGFTFGFYRHFWSTIENDVFEAIKYFFTCGEIPKGCNSTFIALIPKNPDANMVKDFRPISLIGSIYKIIAKILTNRLVGVLGDIVNEVQSAFISERQILDGPFILNEIMQWCRRRKKQSLIFKVDFEKAYDSVRWDFLDDILVKFGFGIKWRGWIQNCL